MVTSPSSQLTSTSAKLFWAAMRLVFEVLLVLMALVVAAETTQANAVQAPATVRLIVMVIVSITAVVVASQSLMGIRMADSLRSIRTFIAVALIATALGRPMGIFPAVLLAGIAMVVASRVALFERSLGKATASAVRAAFLLSVYGLIVCLAGSARDMAGMGAVWTMMWLAVAHPVFRRLSRAVLDSLGLDEGRPRGLLILVVWSIAVIGVWLTVIAKTMSGSAVPSVQLGSFSVQPFLASTWAAVLAVALTYSRREHLGRLDWALAAMTGIGFIVLRELGTLVITLLALITYTLITRGARCRDVLILGSCAAIGLLVLWLVAVGALPDRGLEHVSGRIAHLTGSRSHPELDRVELAFAGAGVLGNASWTPMWGISEAGTRDYSFAILAQSHGWLGLAIVLALYSQYLVGLGAACTAATGDARRLVALGFLVLSVVTFFVPLLIFSKLMVVTGVPMPLIARSGTALALAIVSVGLMAVLASEGSRQREECYVEPA